MTDDVFRSGSRGRAGDARPRFPEQGREESDLKHAQRSAVLEAFFAPVRTMRMKSHVCTKDSPPALHFVHRGVCVSYDLLADGRRQIVSIYLPGDLINAAAISSRRTRQDVIVMGEAQIGTVPLKDVDAAVAGNDILAEAILHEIARRQGILEAWVCALGRKSALERIATLFCELMWRMRAKPTGDDHVCFLPFNQIDLADMLGLSVVHVNRVLKSMRETRLVTFDAGRIEIHDFERLAFVAEFDPGYLL